MPQHVLVNHQDHAAVKVLDCHSPELSESSNFTMVFPTEFRDVQSQYPIFFQKNSDTGQLYPVALLGFEPGENMYLDNSGWNASYIPLMERKQPFFIGFTNSGSDTSENDNGHPNGSSMVVTMDPDSPRVNHANGKELFHADGSPTEFFNEKISVLEQVHYGYEHSEKFVAAMIENDLIEQFVLDIQLNDGSVKQLLGFYTVKEEAVQNLSAEVLGKLSESGFLMPLFMVLASHSALSGLINKKVALEAKP